MQSKVSGVASLNVTNALHPYPLHGSQDLEPLLQRIGDAKIVLLGEASHGTHEYYTWRAMISKRLIEEKNFSFIAVEGDWPDCYRLNRYAKNYPASGKNAYQVLHEFSRWPTWMWANWETHALIEWIRKHNDANLKRKTGFYGLDVYSLWESLEEIIRYLKNADKDTAAYAESAVECFNRYCRKDGQEYAVATSMVPTSCEFEVVQLLTEIRKKMTFYNHDPEAVLNVEQNAVVARNAEKYYRMMIRSGDETWNLRDRHMAQTLEHLMAFHGSDAKAIVWEHNTHIGDARATDMLSRGVLNLGQLVREQFSPENVVLVGFGSYQGEVIAGHSWGDRMRVVTVPAAKEGSWEHYLHHKFKKNALLIFDTQQDSDLTQKRIPHRAIGVVYDPRHEKFGNYVPSVMAKRYDAFLHIDRTTALHPMHIEPNGKQTPETYPWGV